MHITYVCVGDVCTRFLTLNATDGRANRLTKGRARRVRRPTGQPQDKVEYFTAHLVRSLETNWRDLAYHGLCAQECVCFVDCRCDTGMLHASSMGVSAVHASSVERITPQFVLSSATLRRTRR